MSEVELKDLVTNYTTLKSVCTPALTLYTQILHAFSWQNAQLTTCTLLAVSALLIYPIYLQFTVLAVLTGLFSVSYISSISQIAEDRFNSNLLDPVNFINPVYYSLEPESSKKTKDKVIKDYRCMLQELDAALKVILQVRAKVMGVLCWDNFNETRVVLVVAVFLIWAPTVLPVNLLLLFAVLYVSCCNSRCYTAVRRMLADLRNTPPAYQECEKFDSDEEFKDSISDFTNQATFSSMPTQETHDRATSARAISEHLSAASGRPCANCSDSAGNDVMCGFCGCSYCAKCCCNTVTKAQLGVTNPSTKHHLVRVCAECTLNLSTSE